jgi:histone-arginine methyltransferase CARM1
MAKVRFWDQNSFYGVDLSPLNADAKEEIFGMPGMSSLAFRQDSETADLRKTTQILSVVGTFDPRTLLASPSSFDIDFRTIPIPELQEFTIPISWTPNFTGIIHGIAGWFDIDFAPPPGSPSPVAFTLTTAPQAERTHWHQIRLLLREPLAVNALQTVRGWLHMKVNDMRSYTMEAELVIGDEPLSAPGEPATTLPSRVKSATKRREIWQLQDQVRLVTVTGRRRNLIESRFRSADILLRLRSAFGKYPRVPTRILLPVLAEWKPGDTG